MADEKSKNMNKLDQKEEEKVTGGIQMSINATRRDVVKYCPTCKKNRVFYIYGAGSTVCSTCGNPS